MMTFKRKLALGIASLAIMAGGVATHAQGFDGNAALNQAGRIVELYLNLLGGTIGTPIVTDDVLGSVVDPLGGQLAEQNISYVRLNNGYNSELNLKTTAHLTAGALTLTGSSTQATALGTTTAGRFTQGGNAISSSTLAVSVTLTEDQFFRYSVTQVVSDIVLASTFTLPGSSTVTTFIPNAGDVIKMKVQNDTSTAGVYHTYAGGTGTALNAASTTTEGLTLSPGDTADIECWRAFDTDIECQFNIFQ